MPIRLPSTKAKHPAALNSRTRSSVQELLTRPVSILVPNSESTPNAVTTSKYTLLSFVPLTLYSLLHPFKRFANFYFLCVGALQLWPEISVYQSPQPTMWAVLSLLLAVDMYILAREDIARHKADKVANAQKVQVVCAASGEADDERLASWSEVQQGDVVRVRAREFVPSDLLLLRGSNRPGECFVKTQSLDGETDSKLRLAPKLMSTLLEHGHDAAAIRAALKGVVRCEEPNDKVNDFTGQLCADGHEAVVLSEDNVLLRGSQLVQTQWALGLVVACGPDSKIEYGRAKGTSLIKTGHTTIMMNRDIYGMVTWLVLLDILGASFNAMFRIGFGDGQPWYLPSADTGAPSFAQWLVMALTYFMTTFPFVPVGLYVSANIILALGKYFMQQDAGLYYAETDEPCLVRQMSLLDELGQVSHVFADKTGTLTANTMEFRRMAVAGSCYGGGETAISRSLRASGGDSMRPSISSASSPGLCSSDNVPAFGGCRDATKQFVAFEELVGHPSIWDALRDNGADGAMRREMVVAMVVNHTVLLEEVDGEQRLQASSPDELAFVAASEFFGLEFISGGTLGGTIRLLDKLNGCEHAIEVLHIIPYESSRKRMSVVVRLSPELAKACGGGSDVRLYMKGADSVVLERLGDEHPANERRAWLGQTVGEWADLALRTLVWAKRELAPAEYEAWAARYKEASENTEQVALQKMGRPSDIGKLQEEAECGLVLVGATAIEDKLQENVPECLADFRKAGIKVWMLTGDKAGTAKNIAAACNMLPPPMHEASTAPDPTLELTAETHPALHELRTAEVIVMQQRLDCAHIEHAPPKDVRSAFGPWRRARQRVADAAVKVVRDREVARLDEKHPGLAQVRAALAAHVERIRAAATSAGASVAKVVPSDHGTEHFLVIDEKAIEYCTAACTEALAECSNGCKAVVACRARKDQKAQMLNLIKEGVPDSCCLAIGDGANDVAMIKAAHIGIGIIGKEGRQAVNNSDFAIGRFHFVRRLLFVHGRENYRRLSIFAYYMYIQRESNPQSPGLASPADQEIDTSTAGFTRMWCSCSPCTSSRCSRWQAAASITPARTTTGTTFCTPGCRPSSSASTTRCLRGRWTPTCPSSTSPGSSGASTRTAASRGGCSRARSSRCSPHSCRCWRWAPRRSRRPA